MAGVPAQLERLHARVRMKPLDLVHGYMYMYHCTCPEGHTHTLTVQPLEVGLEVQSGISHSVPTFSCFGE